MKKKDVNKLLFKNLKEDMAIWYSELMTVLWFSNKDNNNKNNNDWFIDDKLSKYEEKWRNIRIKNKNNF